MSTATSSLASPIGLSRPNGSRGTPGSRTRPLRHLERWISPIALIALWQLASATGILSERKLAPPSKVVRSAIDLIRDGTLGHATLVSTERAVAGFAIGAVIALLLALLAGLSRLGELAVDPPLQMLRMLPHLGLVPLFIIWMGIGETPKVTLVAFGAIFPLYLNTFSGIRNIDRKTLEAAKVMGLTQLQRIRYVILPGALPQALTGLRQSLGVAWLTLIVAEQMAADDGIGKMINDAREFLMTDQIVVGLAVYMILGLITDAIVRLIERKALAWRS
ncbi:MAG: ABC transporter permease [Nocardioides sp.]|uniref:ABC transporter permease n=1 Tax=Nocardioides sp. TaxID=35761 RepID=UPI0039E68ADB